MMMNKKKRIAFMLAAVMLCMAAFPLTAYAEGTAPEDDEAVVWIPEAGEEPPADPVTDYPEPNPFTPAGTGTVVDNATDEDGKLFYTIVTPDEHVFYLVVDNQRETENVYFLNAVTVADLAALAEIGDTPQSGPLAPAPAEVPEVTPEPTLASPDPAPETGGNNTVMYIIILVIAMLGGGAAWYFKVYRPKQQGAVDGDEYEPQINEAEYGDWDDEQEVNADDDSPPWDDDEVESEAKE